MVYHDGWYWLGIDDRWKSPAIGDGIWGNADPQMASRSEQPEGSGALLGCEQFEATGWSKPTRFCYSLNIFEITTSIYTASLDSPRNGQIRADDDVCFSIGFPQDHCVYHKTCTFISQLHSFQTVLSAIWTPGWAMVKTCQNLSVCWCCGPKSYDMGIQLLVSCNHRAS